MQRLLLLISLWPCVAYSQSFPQFDRFTHKADSSNQAKDYESSIKYYDSALQLPQRMQPEIFGRIYYDIACVYSRLGNQNQAFAYLEKSFALHNLKKHSNPVGGHHLATDVDLSQIQGMPRFSSLVNKYYKGKELAEALNLLKYSKKELSYTELLEFIKIACEDRDPMVRVNGKTIYWKKSGDSLSYNKEEVPIPDFPGLATKPIEFSNCIFKLNLVWHTGLITGTHQQTPLAGLEFHDCRFMGNFSLHGLQISGLPYNYQFLFNNCQFEKTFFTNVELELRPLGNINGFEGCTFTQLSRIGLSGSNPFLLKFKGNKVLNSMSMGGTTTTLLTMTENEFKGDVEIRFNEIAKLHINNNTIRHLSISRCNVTSEFDFLDDKLGGKLVLSESFLPESTSSDIDWGALNGYHIGLAGHDNTLRTNLSHDGALVADHLIDSARFLTGSRQEEIADGKTFRELMGLYSLFINIYKSKNDIESYNLCFIQLKELQTQRLKYLYTSDPSFEKYFRWKLSQLLRFYVRHGTDPARAIVISINIILVFGAFFFFFPSDWDTTSKKRLIQNFKDFIQKNEKGYVKPFFILIVGFMISLINAVTLSLNAFITLGFGNIPTHGIARYFCVLEGFLGWFLLSIFTVAMINQVL